MGEQAHVKSQRNEMGWNSPALMEKAMAPHSSTLAWKNPMDGGAWKAAVLGVTKSRTRLSDFTFTFHFHALEKEMATHSSVLAWRIPGTGEPGGLPSMGSHIVGHDWSNLAAAAAAYWNLTMAPPLENGVKAASGPVVRVAPLMIGESPLRSFFPFLER